jgi:hypothetical protein
MVFCTCQECKALNIESGGREVAPVTKWRHNKKENDWYNYLDNDDSTRSIEDSLIIQETEL